MKKLFAIIALLLINCVFAPAQSKPIKAPSPATAEDSATQRAEAILKLAREAKGGVEKLKQVTDLSYSGNFVDYDQSNTSKQPFTMFLYQAKKVRTEAGAITSGFDGGTPWINDTVQTGQVADETRRRAIREWFVNVLLVPSDMKMSAIALPDSEIDGKPVTVITVEIGEYKLKISFDKQTYLMRQVSYGLMYGPNTVQLDEIQEDYRTVGGIKFAHKTIALERGRVIGELAITDYKINNGIDPVKFSRR